MNLKVSNMFFRRMSRDVSQAIMSLLVGWGGGGH